MQPGLGTLVLLSPHRQTTYFGRPQDKAFVFLFFVFFKCFQNPLGEKLFPTFYCLMRLESSRNMLSAVTSEEALWNCSTYTMLWWLFLSMMSTGDRISFLMAGAGSERLVLVLKRSDTKKTMQQATRAPWANPARTSLGWCLWSDTRDNPV